MLVKVFGSAVYGVDAITITIEVNWMSTGIGVVIVGLPDNAVKESLQRIESTFKSLGFQMPRTKIVGSADFVKSIGLEDFQMESLGFIDLKGKKEALELFALKI